MDATVSVVFVFVGIALLAIAFGVFPLFIMLWNKGETALNNNDHQFSKWTRISLGILGGILIVPGFLNYLGFEFQYDLSLNVPVVSLTHTLTPTDVKTSIPSTPRITRTLTPKPTQSQVPLTEIAPEIDGTLTVQTSTPTPNVEENQDNSTPTPSNYALSFDGVDDYVNISSVENYGSKTITYAVWVKPQNINGDRAILVRGDQSGRLGISLGIRSGKVWVGGRGNNSDWNNSFIGTVPSDTWIHLAAVYAERERLIKVYINGEHIETAADRFFAIDGNSFNTIIGKNHISDTQFFRGLLDDIGIWKRELTVEEIKSLKNGQVDLGDKDLVAYWTFNEGYGHQSTDLSDNVFPGFLGAGFLYRQPNWISVTR